MKHHNHPTAPDPELASGSGHRIGATPDGSRVARATPRARDDRDVTADDARQEIDGGYSAQPKGGLTGGFDSSSGRMQPALPGAPVGGTSAVDLSASGMTVVEDPNLGFDEQDVRDATMAEAMPAETSDGDDRARIQEYTARTGRTPAEIFPEAHPHAKR